MLDEKVDTFKDLDVYKGVLKFAKDIYQVTKQFPKEDIYGIGILFGVVFLIVAIFFYRHFKVKSFPILVI